MIISQKNVNMKIDYLDYLLVKNELSKLFEMTKKSDDFTDVEEYSLENKSLAEKLDSEFLIHESDERILFYEWKVTFDLSPVLYASVALHKSGNLQILLIQAGDEDNIRYRNLMKVLSVNETSRETILNFTLSNKNKAYKFLVDLFYVITEEEDAEWMKYAVKNLEFEIRIADLQRQDRNPE